VQMANDCALESGALDAEIQRSVRELFLAKPMSAACVALFRDEFFARHADNLTAREISAAYEALKDEEGGLGSGGVKKLFALVASKGEVSEEERVGLRPLRKKVRADARADFDREMLFGLVDTYRRPGAGSVSAEVAADVRAALGGRE